MAYWLMKSEPSSYGIDDLMRDRRTSWGGVRNYQVRNMFRDDFRNGDLGFFYHSSCAEPGIAGVMRVASDAYADPSQFDRTSPYYDPKSRRDSPTWLAVDVEFVEKVEPVLGLGTLRETAGLQDLQVLRRGNRLSVTPVTAAEWKAITRLAARARPGSRASRR